VIRFFFLLLDVLFTALFFRVFLFPCHVHARFTGRIWSSCGLGFLICLLFSFFESHLVDGKRMECGIDEKEASTARGEERWRRSLGTVRSNKHHSSILNTPNSIPFPRYTCATLTRTQHTQHYPYSSLTSIAPSPLTRRDRIHQVLNVLPGDFIIQRLDREFIETTRSRFLAISLHLRRRHANNGYIPVARHRWVFADE
jgi:hypothetical protein